ncbi:Catabolite control protein A [Clavibacter michiganensis]|uniref:Catabolite control protein A n=1 Tax=Clavibacter michiganensis TaxID=28447 RepID=A0A251YE30_9MICO|nr:LacI family DNA-binding transcriptional regulator [Clavibacter michiganensis]OUE22501.1 Catabolite control protein A [Clavibacter michiganensis]OUE30329.1 Catabolite control protein A [Clavibacter michiganensis]
MPGMIRSGVSIRDVAREAGVSTATVSRVLTGARGVRPASEAAVRDAASRLGYQPNALGRSLRRMSTSTVGVVVPRVDNPFFPAIIQRTEQLLHDHGLEMLLCTSSDDPVLESEKIGTLLGRQVDGLLVCSCDAKNSQHALDTAAQRVPVVQFDQCTDDWNGDFVGVDDAAGIAQSIEHLRRSGRRSIAYIGSRDSNSSGASRDRAFRALVPAHRGIRLGDFSSAWGEEAAFSLLRQDDPPDSIVCGNDLIALGAIRAAVAMGIPVPRRLAVVGFDDIPMATMMRPELSTVRQPVADLAQEAVRMLTDRMSGRSDAAERLLLPTEFIRRASS